MSAPTPTHLSPLSIVESKTNPRKHFDEAKLAELAESIRKVGVLQPVLVRPKGDEFELICGHRRLRAAKLAQVKAIPVVVRELSDVDALEAQVTENLQRDDLHPLEEAEGYRLLMKRHGHKVETVAAQVGRSVKYVYDRVKLLALTKEAQKLFFDGKITAGHAVILARLSAKDQERAIKPEINRFGGGHGVWQGDHSLFDAEDARDEYSGLKPVSVRELQSWVDRCVRLDRTAVDPMLFPETAASIETAAKIVPITYDSGLSPELKGDERTVCVQSWKRADGKRDSKACEHKVLGVIVVGRDRGQAFDVCIAKDKCKTHWAKEAAARKRAAKQRESGPGSGAPKGDKKPKKSAWEIQQAERDAKEKRYVSVLPHVLHAVADRIKTASLNTLEMLIQESLKEDLYNVSFKEAATLVPNEKTADSLLRHVTMALLHHQIGEGFAHDNAQQVCKTLGVDLKAIYKEHAPAETPAAPAKAKKRKAS